MVDKRGYNKILIATFCALSKFRFKATYFAFFFFETNVFLLLFNNKFPRYRPSLIMLCKMLKFSRLTQNPALTSLVKWTTTKGGQGMMRCMFSPKINFLWPYSSKSTNHSQQPKKQLTHKLNVSWNSGKFILVM